MRFTLVLLLLCVTAHANPRIAGDDVWMSSEKLSGSISVSNATVVGTFSFERTAGRRYPAEEGVTLHMELPIWLPDPCQDPAVQAFWQAYEQKPRAPETLRLLEGALYLRAEAGGNVVHTRNGKQRFGSETNQASAAAASRRSP